ncbi:MAG: succinylglutamate desuccinylase/aspartoacylase family protein [Myxococcota bacterium]
MTADWIETHPALRPTYCDDLDVPALAVGKLHRLGIAIIEDGASRAVRLPVLVARGTDDGPIVGLTAAVHGNELNGISAIHALFRRIDPARLRGTVVGVPIANIPAFVRHQRRYPDLEDLNTVFPGKPNGNESSIYAHRLLTRVVNRFDVLLDLHTASFGRVNSFYVRADLSNATTAHLARLVGAEIIVHNPSRESTLRGAAENLGIPAVTVEIGDPHTFDADLIRQSRIGLRDILEELGMVEPDPEHAVGTAVECVKSSWLYTDTGGMLTVLPACATQVSAGQEIARLVDPWGQLLRTYRAPHDGVVIGKSENPVARSGSRILHLGVVGEVAIDRDVPSLDRIRVGGVRRGTSTRKP